MFDPHGLAGLAYWYALYPVHSLIFAGMLRRIGQAAINVRPQQLAYATNDLTADGEPVRAPRRRGG